LAAAAPDAARHLARSILSEGRFHQPSFPRPLHGVLRAFGEGLGAPVRGLEDAVDAVGALVPGGVVVVWIVLALLLAGATALLVARHSRRTLSGGEAVAGASTGMGERLERASELVAAAEAAERDGRLADAVRLRFRAGLVRLAERGTIAAARSTPTAEVSRVLASPRFDALAHRFDEIAYGDAAPEPEDVEAARREWPAVLSGSDRA
jgi:hypothetical protein